MKAITHVLLAGDKDYAQYLLEDRNKCLLEFSRKKLLDLTLSAFASATEVNRLIVVGPDEELEGLVPQFLNKKPVRFLPQKESLSKNVEAALQLVEENWPGNLTIFVTNDCPFLTGAELDRFAISAVRREANISIAVCRVSDGQLADPLVQQYIRSIVVTADGRFLLANQIALKVANRNLLDTLQRLFDLRKQAKWSTVLRTLLYAAASSRMRGGITTWMRHVAAKRIWLLQPNGKLAGRMSLPCREIEIRLGKLLDAGSPVAIVDVPDAVGCFDADTLDQLRELRKALASNAKPLLSLELSHV